MGGLDQALSSHFRTSKDGKTGGDAREQTSQMVADCFSPPANPGFEPTRIYSDLNVSV